MPWPAQGGTSIQCLKILRTLRTHSRSTSHRFGHLLVTPEGLYSETDCLQLGAHLIEFLDVSSGSNEVFRHDFACWLNEGGAELSHGR